MNEIKIEDMIPSEAIKIIFNKLNDLTVTKNDDKIENIKILLTRVISQNIEIRKHVEKCAEIADTLTVNLTKLYEKVDSNDAYLHGMLPALACEMGNHREAFVNIFQGLNTVFPELDIPYDEIKGWDILNEPNNTQKEERRSVSLYIKSFFKKFTKTKKREGK